jgi:hypothetical protein
MDAEQKLDSLIAQADEQMQQAHKPLEEIKILDYLEEDMHRFLPDSGIQQTRFSADIKATPKVSVGDIWWNERQFTTGQNMLISEWVSRPQNKKRLTERFVQKLGDYMGKPVVKEKKYVLTEHQVRLIKELYEMASKRDLNNIQGARLTTHKEVVDAIMKFMSSGKFGSVLFAKTDNSLRQTNVRSAPKSVTAGMKGAPKYNPSDYNLLLLYDNNKSSNEGKRGSFIQARFEGWMIFKGGSTVYDFTKVNASALAALKPEDQQTVQQTLQNLKAAGFNPIVVEPSAETPPPQSPESGTDIAM